VVAGYCRFLCSSALIAAGILAVPLSLFPAATYPVGQVPKFIMVGDFNGDGKQDLVTANFGSADISVLLGNGDGTFRPAVSYPVGTNPTSIVVVDFNGDGKQDLAIANVERDCKQCTGNVSVLLGNGDGTFQRAVNYTVGGGSAVVGTGDFNRDGMPDIAGGNSSHVFVMLGKGNGGFRAPVSYPVGPVPHAMVVGDFNRDGKQDIAVCNFSSTTVSVLLGNGDGTFQPAVDYAVGDAPHGMAAGDLNHDGKLDLITANQNSNDISVLLGNGDGTFQPAKNYPAGSGSSSVVVGDFNHDGKEDLAVANSSCVAPNLGCNVHSSSLVILFGNDDGSFQPPVTYAMGSGADAVAMGDFNGDGIEDLATGNLGGTVLILLGAADGTFH